ncbi:uncharacterized protein LOC111042808 [Myzus persicae]|uniref:uncharacterized protein LOC111042808 n=1 Tax=Myzus persicae TaxID=13164 RepID=UPI000B9334D9|nr:uncharacterized protein LOC111042808 [Myzus persicae]
MEINATMEIVKSNQGNYKICLNGYTYVHQKDCKFFKRWRCAKYSSFKCLAILKTSLQNSNPREIHEHNHSADKNAIAAIKVKQEIKNKALSSNDTPGQIFSEVIGNLDVDVLAELPKEEYLKRSIRYHRSFHNPNEPQNIKEIVIDGEWALLGNNRLLLRDNGPEASERIIIFATDEHLQLLSESDTWYLDGNFGLSPKFFLQLYVIRVKKNNVFVTTIYCILQRKTKNTYVEMFQIIMDECAERNVYPDPKCLHLDFESAVIEAAKEVIGVHIDIKGCFYHLCQSTFRKIQELGFASKYHKDEEFRKQCGMIDALAFLPLHLVEDGMKYLKYSLPENLMDLLDYFDSYYVNGKYRRIGNDENNMRFRKLPPMFPPAVWNVNKTTLNDCHRTNNIVEGWNNRFSKLVGQKHPTMWKLIRKIKNEIDADRAQLALDALGEPRRTKRGQNQTIKIRLKELVIRQSEDKLSIGDFLTAVSNNIRKRTD